MRNSNMPNFNHAYTIPFEVVSRQDGNSISPEEILVGLKRKVAHFESNLSELEEAAGLPIDTFETGDLTSLEQDFFDKVYCLWQQAAAFKINSMVCGDFCLGSPEELADAEDSCVLSLYFYSVAGGREFYIDRQMIVSGKMTEEGLVIDYLNGETFEIRPLFFK